MIGVRSQLYEKAATQLRAFSADLGRTQRYLLAQGVCDTIEDASTRDAERAHLARAIAAAQDIDSGEAPGSH